MNGQPQPTLTSILNGLMIVLLNIFGNRVLFNLRAENVSSWNTSHAVELDDLSFDFPTISPPGVDTLPMTATDSLCSDPTLTSKRENPSQIIQKP